MDKTGRTEYAGVKFRSGIEARWAERLDALGIAWEYESIHFGDRRRYTPDFRLDGKSIFLEVKGYSGELNANIGLPVTEGAALMVVYGYPWKVDHVKLWLPGEEVQLLRRSSVSEAYADAQAWLTPVG